MKLVNEVTIYEVGLRDGLQLESKVLTAEEKLDVFNLLDEAKVSEVEFGSLSIPDWFRKWRTRQISILKFSSMRQTWSLLPLSLI